MTLLLILTLEGTAERHQLDAGSLTVGRADNNDWVLTDPTARHALSRRHCRFDMAPQGATVTDLGSTNGTRVDGRLLAPHTPTPLHDGQVVEIGMRHVMVELVEATALSDELPALGMPSADPAVGVSGVSMPRRNQSHGPAAAAPARPQKTLKGALFEEAEPGDSLPVPPLQGDPLANAFKDDLPPLPRNHTSTVLDERPNTAAAPHLEALLPNRQSSAGAPGSWTDGVFRDPLGSFNPATKQKRQAPEPKAHDPAPKSRVPPDPERDPFGLGLAEQAASSRPESKEEPAAPVRSRREMPVAGADNSRGNDATKTDDTTGAALRAAFLAGANLPTSTADDRTPEAFFREAGRMFAGLADGLRELLAVRAVIKNHAGLDRTQISATLNNPLKLSANAEEAAASLLGKPEDGYMDPLVAVAAGFRDLKAHELAVLDGVQSAVDELLELFNPSTLEHELDDSGMLSNLLQGGRRARLWELYQERYEDIARSARSHFMGRLDDAFRTGYARKSAEVSENSDPPVAQRPGTFRL
jgi:type VI secretion system protein